jgi:hypothetical protein
MARIGPDANAVPAETPEATVLAAPQAVVTTAPQAVVTEQDYPIGFDEFYLMSDATKTMLAGLKASFDGDLAPRMLSEWNTALDAYKVKPIK